VRSLLVLYWSGQFFNTVLVRDLPTEIRVNLRWYNLDVVLEIHQIDICEFFLALERLNDPSRVIAETQLFDPMREVVLMILHEGSQMRVRSSNWQNFTGGDMEVSGNLVQS